VAGPKDAFPWREGVVPVEVDGELLVLDAEAGRVVRLSGPARSALEGRRSVRPSGLASDTPGVVDALAALGLTQERMGDADRRAVLRAGALAALGVSVLALPSASAAATGGGGGGGDGLFATGTGDQLFTAAGAPNQGVYAIRTQSDGKVVIGGDFTLVGGVSRGRLARLNADGTLDTTFANPGLTSTVSDVDVDVDDSVVAVGPALMGPIRRFLANGAGDPSFVVPNVWNGAITNTGTLEGVRIDASGRLYIAGQFSAVSGESRTGLARLHANGALDTSFTDPGLNGFAWQVRTSGNTVVVAGEFSATAAGTYGKLVRLHPNGATDTGFGNPNVGGPYRSIRRLAVDGAGRVTIVGGFTSVAGNSAYAKVARISADGTPDASFVPPAISGSNGDVIAVTGQSDGRVVIGGRFTSVGGATRNYIARLEANGAPESDFDPNANGQVWALDLDSSGRILVGGFFTEIGGIARSYLARLS